MSELKSAPLSTFPFDATFVLSKDRHLHVLKLCLINPEDDIPSPSSEISIPISIHKKIDHSENKQRTYAENNNQRNKESPVH